MKILYDHQIFSIQKYGGISRYFAQIISNLPQQIQTEVAIKYSNNEYLKGFNLSIFDFPFEKFLPGISFRGKHRLFGYIEKLKNNPSPEIVNKNLSIEHLKKQDFDIFHPTYYDDYFLEYIGNKPFVLTIHDMIHEKYPELNLDTKLIINKAKLAEKASHIIAVSQNTKKDIIELLNIPESKISVIYHASSLQIANSKPPIPDSEDYLLFVGDRWTYKNFLFFVLAIQPLLKERENLKIVCTGRPFSKEESLLLKELKLEHKFAHLFVQEEQFYQLYRNAKAFIFPSYYEGFGIPIIEAFQSECPVVLSNSSCFPEIAEDAAIYFDPKNKTQLVDAITRVLDNHKIRETLIEKGKNRLKFFSWENSAKQTLEVYKKFCNS